VQYDLIGSGDFGRKIKSMALKLGLKERVVLRGSQDESHIIRALGEAHIFILPSFGLGEASPVALIEAMATGLPSVVTEIGGTKDIISNGVEGFLVPQRNSLAIADAVECLLVNPAHWAEMGQSARQRAEREFDVRLVAERIIGAIEHRLKNYN
jgi:glycosyltransferase involved in cell wall biosynthesis